MNTLPQLDLHAWPTLTDISLPGKPRLQRELMQTSEKSIDPSAGCT